MLVQKTRDQRVRFTNGRMKHKAQAVLRGETNQQQHEEQRELEDANLPIRKVPPSDDKDIFKMGRGSFNLDDILNASEAPSLAPFPSPTTKPTQSPTTKPTQSPTTNPTQSPTTSKLSGDGPV
eukprot:scaffold21_cov107-Cylindrotheca_fusiformis.AAC.1